MTATSKQIFVGAMALALTLLGYDIVTGHGRGFTPWLAVGIVVLVLSAVILQKGEK
jgi:hypothetical protein